MIIYVSLVDFLLCLLYRESLLNHMLFHEILEKQTVLMWPLMKDLLQLAKDSSIRVFCRVILPIRMLYITGPLRSISIEIYPSVYILWINRDIL